MKTWILEFKEQALKDLRKLDRPIQKQIYDYLKNRVISSGDPRLFGKPLHGNLHEFWRYRVGDYRILCSIEDETCTVLAVRIGHRRDIYEG